MPKDPHIYFKVHYHIEAGYRMGKGIPDKEKNWAFQFDIIRLLHDCDFRFWKKGDSSAWQCSRGAESLYCHPTDISGWIREDKVKDIASALTYGRTFRLLAYEVTGRGRYFTEEELRQALEEKTGEIATRLLEAWRSPARAGSPFIPDVRSGIPYVDKINMGNITLRDIEKQFVQKVFFDLVSSGAIAPEGNEDPETALRLLWTKNGVSKKRQDDLIAEAAAKAQPGALVGPFRIPGGGKAETSPAG